MSNLAAWDFADEFTGEEAACLILGITPNTATAEKEAVTRLLDVMKSDYENAKKVFVEDSDYCLSHLKNPRMLQSKLILFGDYYPQLDYEDALNILQSSERGDFEVQKFPREEIVRWLSEYSAKSEYAFDKGIIPNKIHEPTQKIDGNKFSAKERNTLLKMIYGMAVDGYGYSPEQAKSPIPAQLQAVLDILGIPVTNETILEKLKEGQQVLNDSLKNTKPN